MIFADDLRKSQIIFAYFARCDYICTVVVGDNRKQSCDIYKNNSVLSNLIRVKMVFTDYMNTLPNEKQETIKRISEVTMTSVSSVYRWISGEIDPPAIKKNAIAALLKMDVNELFPADHGKR